MQRHSVGGPDQLGHIPQGQVHLHVEFGQCKVQIESFQDNLSQRPFNTIRASFKQGRLQTIDDKMELELMLLQIQSLQ